jgi:hypothetical protein
MIILYFLYNIIQYQRRDPVKSLVLKRPKQFVGTGFEISLKKAEAAYEAAITADSHAALYLASLYTDQGYPEGMYSFAFFTIKVKAFLRTFPKLFIGTSVLKKEVTTALLFF